MAKFTKLNIGDAVASSGGRVWKKLSAEIPIDYNTIVGTWVFNNTIVVGSMTQNTKITNFDDGLCKVNGEIYESLYGIASADGTSSIRVGHTGSTSGMTKIMTDGVWLSEVYKTIEIINESTSAVDAVERWLNFLKINATKIA